VDDQSQSHTRQHHAVPTPHGRAEASRQYVTRAPLVPRMTAAGTFGDPQHIEDDGFEWVAVE
jgi:hypothetical protein